MKKPHHFNPTILREYDIRGIVDQDLNSTDAYALGRSFGTFVKRRAGHHVCVGFDGRLTSPELSGQLIKGLVECGLRVENIGLGPSPMLYFAVKSRGADAGVMVTGSHNPSNYNGFKMLLQKESVYGALIQELGTIAVSGDFENGDGSVETIDIQDDFVDRLLLDLDAPPKNGKHLKIAWDNGNGAAGEILRRLTEKLPGEHILLFDDIDGTFPNHHPDPTVDKNLVDLQAAVAEHNCDLGIAFDGDGDRIGVVDENGGVIRCDLLMGLYAADVLAAYPGAHIIGDVKCSSVMFDEIARLGGKPVIWKTGHSLVKAKMAELNAPLAGELSGHIFFADKYYGYDDALYCGVRLINLVAHADNGLSSLTAHMPTLYNTPELRIDVVESEKFQTVDNLLTHLRAQEGVDLSDIDGARVTTKDGWWLIRASNTQSCLVARAEASSAEGLERLKQHASAQMAEIGQDFKF